MIVIAVVVGIALVLCVAGWVPVVRDALRADHVLPGPPSAAVVLPDADPLPEAVTA